MAIHIPLFPIFEGNNLGENDCYLTLADDFRQDNRTQWENEELIYEYGRLAVNELFKYKLIMFKTPKLITLSFLLPGTIPNMILDLVDEEPRSFLELITKLPKHTHISSQELKNYLSFLYNFGKIQSFVTTGSAISFIASDGKDHDENHPIERAIDRIYHFADRIENQGAYQVNPDETVAEFIKLC